MQPISFHGLPLWGNLAVFAGSAAVIWFAGFRLSIHGDAIAERKQLGRAFFGALFLGVATSLPEVATTVTASLLGNAALAVSNLMGGVATQVAVLAVVDLLLVQGALTYFAPKPVLLLSGVLLVFQMALVLAAMAAGEFVSLLGVGLWPLLLLLSYVASVYFMFRYEGRGQWAAVDIPDESYEPDEQDTSEADLADTGEKSFARLCWLFAGDAALVLVAGWAVSSAADALAAQTGLGSSFVGATLLAVATSLPEVSTTMGAVRVGAYAMAIANIFGTNLLEAGLLFLADVSYRGGLIMNQVDRGARFVAALSIMLTCLYLWGLLERRDRTVFGMGVDSALVLVTWIAGMGMLHALS